MVHPPNEGKFYPRVPNKGKKFKILPSFFPLAYSKDLVEVILRLPYTKRQFLMEVGLGTPKTVGNSLSAWEEAGFWVSKKVGKENLYLNTGFINILENSLLN